jgi:U3 small nucleolar RNA-associated protein 21
LFRRDRITCVHISSDCRWMLTSSMDNTLRVWDIPAGLCLQAMSLGSPVTSLSLSDTGDLLATTHVHKRGVFLWSNQHLFGDPSQLALFQEGVVVPVGLPQIAALGEGAGRQEEVRLLADGGLFAAGDGDSSDEEAEPSSSSSEESDSEEAGQQGKHPAAAGRSKQQQRGSNGRSAGTSSESEGSEEEEEEDGVPAYEAKDATGAPVPLAPGLATLSSLPKAQWQTLLHLDTIKARSRPLQPPKKPEAAPFFLPTVPSLARQPVFDTTAAAAAAGKGEGGSGSKSAANGHVNGTAAADEDSGSDIDMVVGSEDAEQEGGAAGSSRVLRTKPLAADAPQATPFLHLLRAGGVDKDWASFMSHLRGLTPAALDLELRSLVLLEGATELEVSQG